MQLLDSHLNQSEAASERLHQELQEIVHKLKIESTFHISHPDYKPLELPKEAVARFQHLPEVLQNKYLSLQISSFLYGIYYNGSLKETLALDSEESNETLHKNLENNTYLGIDLEFYDQLHSFNHGQGFLSSGWRVVKHDSDSSLAVNKNGLTVYATRDRHLTPEQQTATVGDLIAIRMPKNMVQNGFYMAVGNAGPQNHQDCVRVYFNLTPSGATAVMNSLTAEINAISIPFSFKALYNPDDYKRHDSAVLYFDKKHYQVIQSVLQKVYVENQFYFNTLGPLFTKVLAPGLTLAEEPRYKFAEQESFGMNRCQMVANGLLAAWQQGDDSPENRMTAIRQEFALYSIEMQRPYLNANSEDIYTPLQL
ncbi:hypothetical protein WA1_40015 [Scytonema hofmannii PCC 7110]|uniref:Uncharacterized protein n=1 Tax=Scytonema hofmannii PCC 7110 TaxID=128403 RepID=A0A139WYX2_9CYAN|nr:T3SS effector HopA1 family protein [Scytonema hofmannii]KYC37649.1 hypothetical protein WA1_40015 [Scytonema hofmannii PCC 7110]